MAEYDITWREVMAAALREGVARQQHDQAANEYLEQVHRLLAELHWSPDSDEPPAVVSGEAVSELAATLVHSYLVLRERILIEVIWAACTAASHDYFDGGDRVRGRWSYTLRSGRMMRHAREMDRPFWREVLRLGRFEYDVAWDAIEEIHGALGASPPTESEAAATVELEGWWGRLVPPAGAVGPVGTD